MIRPRQTANRWQQMTPRQRRRTSQRLNPNQRTFLQRQLARARNQPQPNQRPQQNNPAVRQSGDPSVRNQAPVTPPPPTMETQEMRRSANAGFQTTQSGLLNQLHQNALQYGDPALIRTYAQQLGIPTQTENPASALSMIAREREDAARQLEQSMNRQNTFFSGLHGENQRRVSDEAANQMAAAFAQWAGQDVDLRNQLLAAQDERQATLNEAGIRDVQAALEAPAPEVPIRFARKNESRNISFRFAALDPSVRARRIARMSTDQRQSLRRQLNPQQKKVFDNTVKALRQRKQKR